MKKENIKVGMSCEVITITADEPRSLVNKGNTGVVKIEYIDGDVSACIGISDLILSDWFIPKGEFKKVGRLTVTKIK